VQIASRLKKEDLVSAGGRNQGRRGDRLDDAVDFHHSKQFDELFFR
jgi:hypothetical protein